MKRFLYPIDFSDGSRETLEYAANFSKIVGAELTLLHILVNPELQEVANVQAGQISLLYEGEDSAREDLESYAQLVEDEFSIPCRTVVQRSYSGIINGLKMEIDSTNYDMIIMETNGTENLRQFYFGSHSYRLSKKIPVPVLIVPEEYPFNEPKQIVYATDYELEDPNTVKYVMDMTKEFKSNISVLHVSRNPTHISDVVYKSFRNILEDEVDVSRIHFDRVISTQITKAINDYMTRNNKDLLVLFSKDYSLTEKLFHKSVTKDLSARCAYPILVI